MYFTNKFVHVFFVFAVVAIALFTVQACILYMKDGSRLTGEITKMTEPAIEIKTSFAGEIRVPITNLDVVTRETRQMVALKSGDRINAYLNYDPDTSTQRLLQTSCRDLTIEPDQLLGVSADGDPAPETLIIEKQLAEYKKKVNA